ncbi:MAG: TRAP transporter small permease [Clostridia bacterium]
MKKTLLFCAKNFEEIVASATLFVVVMLTIINVISRNLFKYSFISFNEIILLCFTWTVFIGASACYKRKMHYGVTVIVGLLPPKGRQLVAVIVDFILLVTFCFSTAIAANLTANVTTRITPFLQISYRWVNVSAVIGMGLMAFHSVEFLIQDVMTLLGRDRKLTEHDSLDWEV